MEILPGQRAEATHLDHEPFEHPVAVRAVLRQQQARFLGQIDQYRARFEDRYRARRAIAIDNYRDLAVGIDPLELGRKAVPRHDVDRHRLICKAELFQRQVDFHDIGAVRRVEGDQWASFRKLFVPEVTFPRRQLRVRPGSLIASIPVRASVGRNGARRRTAGHPPRAWRRQSRGIPDQARRTPHHSAGRSRSASPQRHRPK